MRHANSSSRQQDMTACLSALIAKASGYFHYLQSALKKTYHQLNTDGMSFAILIYQPLPLIQSLKNELDKSSGKQELNFILPDQANYYLPLLRQRHHHSISSKPPGMDH